MLGLVAGCATQLLVDGRPVYDQNGNAVMVSGSTQEKVEQASSNLRTAVRSTVDRSAADGKGDVQNVSFTDANIRDVVGPNVTEEEMVAFRAAAEAEVDRYRKEVVYPARVASAKKTIEATVDAYIKQGKLVEASSYLMRVAKTGIEDIDKPVAEFVDEMNKTKVAPAVAQQTIGKVGPYVEKCMASGKFANAREALWRASTSGNAGVDALVREYAVEQLHTVVNPAQWLVIDGEINAKVAGLLKENKFDEATKWLQGYPRVRTYSLLLDEKLKTVEAELVKVGVAADDMKSILVATGKLVGDAEKIVDMTDVTTNSVTTIEGTEIAGTSPDLKAYEERLEEYRKMLLRYNCTEGAATGIITKFDGEVKPLLNRLVKPATKTEGSSEEKSFLQLGTGALNVRIDKLVAKLLDEIADKKAKHLAALRKAAIKAAIDEMTAKVKKLVSEGKYAEAREVIWAATSTDDLDMNAQVRVPGMDLMLKLVNPSNWKAIEKEFAAKVKEATDSSSYDDAIAWAQSYPDIRTYTELIDSKLDVVQKELVKLGIPEGKVKPVAAETKKATIEMERLASHVDTVNKTVVGGKGLPLDDYKKLLADYRKALELNDCTEANAKKLVEDFDKKIQPLVALISGGVEKAEWMLGSNAINDRLAKLRAKTLDDLKLMKYKHVFTDLIAKVSEAVAAGRYGDARNVIRDVALVQDVDWDARIYATRIGLLNSVVNPNQCAALLKEIDEKAKELFDAKKYEEFAEYAKNYEYVHDTYQQIADALEQVKAAMIGLTIAQEDASAYIDKLSARIREMMEKRQGSYTTETDKDLSELEKALAELEKGIVAQYYKPEEVAAFCKVVKNEIIALITKAPDPMTTWEMNELLRAQLAKYTAQIKDLIAKRDAANAAKAYATLLANIDAEVSFDSQIAMAEDAIAKQLGIKCPFAYLRMNALLGEYARTMRLLKLGKKIDPEQATVALLGGIYLDQAAVVTRAIELGADVNGKSSRDPLGRTGVLIAIQSGHNAFLKQLTDAKAALNPVDANGDTALHYAVQRGNLAVVKAMLAKNEVDKTNKAGESALFIAVRKNQAALVSALTAAKANVQMKNAKGQTPMDVACLAGSRDVLDPLAKAGADYGPAQLIIAATKDRLAVAQWLIGKGVDVNAPGVMEATIHKSDTQCYLVHEGGILKCFETKGCCDKAAACAADKKGKKAAPAPAPAPAAAAAPVKEAEVTGTINFKVSEVK